MRYVSRFDSTRTPVVWVTYCSGMPLSATAAFVGREAEWPMEVMLAGMREHYPEIGWTDRVQVIEHLTPAETRRRPDYPDRA